jgi:hypothetical protein
VQLARVYVKLFLLEVNLFSLGDKWNPVYGKQFSLRGKQSASGFQWTRVGDNWNPPGFQWHRSGFQWFSTESRTSRHES